MEQEGKKKQQTKFAEGWWDVLPSKQTVLSAGRHALVLYATYRILSLMSSIQKYVENPSVEISGRIGVNR